MELEEKFNLSDCIYPNKILASLLSPQNDLRAIKI